MSSLSLNIPHNLSKEEALDRIKKLLGNVKKEQADQISNVKEEWKGDTGTFNFTIKGFDLSGNIRVNASSVDINGNVPFAISLFKGKIKSIIHEKAAALLK
jgi:hypothetical protein